MKQEILTQFPWPWLPTAALVLFFVFFVGLIFYVCMKSSENVFIKAEILPLSDGEKYERF